MYKIEVGDYNSLGEKQIRKLSWLYEKLKREL